MASAAATAGARRAFYLLGSAGLLVAGLYWGQRVLIPLALAVLLTFVLAPPVSLLERRGLDAATAEARAQILYWTFLGFALSGTPVPGARLRPLLDELLRMVAS